MSTRKFLKSFETIYNNTYNDLLKFVVCKCGNLNDVDDIIQDTYLELFKTLKSNKEIFDISAYLTTIAKTKIIDNYKKNQKIKTISMFQKNEEKEFFIDLDSRNRFGIRIHIKK